MKTITAIGLLFGASLGAMGCFLIGDMKTFFGILCVIIGFSILTEVT